jgi:two-component system phosphate regulon response regulator PhoB
MSASTGGKTGRRKNSAPVILIVEDESEIRELLCFTLRRSGYNLIEAGSAEDAIRCLDDKIPDLAVIDWMLPGMSGLDLARYVRGDELATHLPLIMLTARAEEADKLKSFDVGIDDYLTKPFSPRELLARIKALLRRTGAPEDNVLVSGRFRINLEHHSVQIDEVDIHLGPTEFRLLAWLMRNADKPFTRSQLLDRVWGRSVYIEERTVDVHILRLRKALQPFQMHRCLRTVRGVGYRFSSADACAGVPSKS